jgi:sec-independent protein translocase protein TatA
MIGGIGPTEIIIVLVIALLVLGPKRLPETAKSMGRGIREFKNSIAGRNDDDDAVLTGTVDTPKPS